jgi:hypothetical protein
LTSISSNNNKRIKACNEKLGTGTMDHNARGSHQQYRQGNGKANTQGKQKKDDGDEFMRLVSF